MGGGCVLVNSPQITFANEKRLLLSAQVTGSNGLGELPETCLTTYNVHSLGVPSPQHVIAAPNQLASLNHTCGTNYFWTLKTNFIKINAANIALNTSFVYNHYSRSCVGFSSFARWTHIPPKNAACSPHHLGQWQEAKYHQCLLLPSRSVTAKSPDL